MNILRIHKPYDEDVEILLDGKSVASANHDEDGWSGMALAEGVAVNIATKMGWQIERTYGSGSAETHNDG